MLWRDPRPHPFLTVQQQGWLKRFDDHRAVKLIDSYKQLLIGAASPCRTYWECNSEEGRTSSSSRLRLIFGLWHVNVQTFLLRGRLSSSFWSPTWLQHIIKMCTRFPQCFLSSSSLSLLNKLACFSLVDLRQAISVVLCLLRLVIAWMF